MSSKVEVLCPNGHRVTVKTTPNTKIFQVLEEACNKKGFIPSSDYELRHGSSKKALDLTLILRFAGLPNNAKLEMVKAAKSRESNDVTIALQLESGERLQHDFNPQTKLWEILAHWHKQGPHKLTESPEGLHPVCIYLREEVQGIFALQQTTLQDLGLLGGRAAIRFLHKSIDNQTLEEIEQRVNKEKLRKATLAAKGTALQQQESASSSIAKQTSVHDATASISLEKKSSDSSTEPMDTDVANQSSAESVSMASNATATPSSGSGQEAMDISEEQLTSQSINTPMEADTAAKAVCSARPKTQPCRQPTGPDTSIPGVQIFRPGEMQLSPQQEQIARQLAEAIMPGVFPERREADLERLRYEREKRLQQRAAQARILTVVPQAVLPEFKFPEETKGQNLYNNDLCDKDVEDYKPCDRGVVLYSTEDIKPSGAVPVELNDEFFEVTEADVKNMWGNLQRQLMDEAEQPLMTQAMRKAQSESRLNKYGHVFLRFTFQDTFVLQGTFKPRETVHNVYKFVKEHLQDKTVPFYLYTAPPKRVLEDRTQTLMEANLVPMTVVYFGSEIKQDHYLSAGVLAEKSCLLEADKAIIAHMPEDSSSSTTTAPSSSHHSNKRPTPQGVGQTTGSDGAIKTPKWFKVGKK